MKKIIKWFDSHIASFYRVFLIIAFMMSLLNEYCNSEFTFEHIVNVLFVFCAFRIFANEFDISDLKKETSGKAGENKNENVKE